MAKNYRHIVLFRLFSSTNLSEQKKVVKLLQNLGKDNPDILEWSIRESKDRRKGLIFVQNSLFKNEESFLKYQKSKRHLEMVTFVKNVADWFVADYRE